jgi:hypothetical protein
MDGTIDNAGYGIGRLYLNTKMGSDDVLRTVGSMLGGTDRIGAAASRGASRLLERLPSEATGRLAENTASKVASETMGKAAESTAGKVAEGTASKVAGETAGKVAGGALGGAIGSAVMGVGVAQVGADLGTLAIDVADPKHEAKSVKNGDNVVSGAITGLTNGFDTLCEGVGSNVSSAQSARRKALEAIPGIGGALAGVVGAADTVTNCVGSLAANTVHSALTSFEGFASAAGNEINGSKSTHADRLGERTVTKDDSLADAIYKNGIVGAFDKVTGRAKTKSEAAASATSEATNYVRDAVESGSMTKAQARTLASRLAPLKGDGMAYGKALVGFVDDVRSNGKTIDGALAALHPRALADAPVDDMASEQGLECE